MGIIEIILTVAGVITALGVIFGLLFTFFKWILSKAKNDTDIKQIKDEQCLLTYAVLACLKGLKEQGCDGPVTEAIDKIEKHINIQAHKY